MPNETSQEALKKIPQALRNLHLAPNTIPMVSNYIHNLVLTILKSPEVNAPAKFIEELSKV